MLHIGKVHRSHFAPIQVAGFGLKREASGVKREEWGMKREDMFFLYNSELHLSGNA
jgi:hypothetical protein